METRDGESFSQSASPRSLTLSQSQSDRARARKPRGRRKRNSPILSLAERIVIARLDPENFSVQTTRSPHVQQAVSMTPRPDLSDLIRQYRSLEASELDLGRAVIGSAKEARDQLKRVEQSVHQPMGAGGAELSSDQPDQGKASEPVALPCTPKPQDHLKRVEQGVPQPMGTDGAELNLHQPMKSVRAECKDEQVEQGVHQPMDTVTSGHKLTGVDRAELRYDQAEQTVSQPMGAVMSEPCDDQAEQSSHKPMGGDRAELRFDQAEQSINQPMGRVKAEPSGEQSDVSIRQTMGEDRIERSGVQPEHSVHQTSGQDRAELSCDQAEQNVNRPMGTARPETSDVRSEQRFLPPKGTVREEPSHDQPVHTIRQPVGATREELSDDQLEDSVQQMDVCGAGLRHDQAEQSGQKPMGAGGVELRDQQSDPSIHQPMGVVTAERRYDHAEQSVQRPVGEGGAELSIYHFERSVHQPMGAGGAELSIYHSEQSVHQPMRAGGAEPSLDQPELPVLIKSTEGEGTSDARKELMLSEETRLGERQTIQSPANSMTFAPCTPQTEHTGKASQPTSLPHLSNPRPDANQPGPATGLPASSSPLTLPPIALQSGLTSHPHSGQNGFSPVEVPHHSHNTDESRSKPEPVRYTRFPPIHNQHTTSGEAETPVSSRGSDPTGHSRDSCSVPREYTGSDSLRTGHIDIVCPQPSGNNKLVRISVVVTDAKQADPQRKSSQDLHDVHGGKHQHSDHAGPSRNSSVNKKTPAYGEQERTGPSFVSEDYLLSAPGFPSPGPDHITSNADGDSKTNENTAVFSLAVKPHHAHDSNENAPRDSFVNESVPRHQSLSPKLTAEAIKCDALNGGGQRELLPVSRRPGLAPPSSTPSSFSGEKRGGNAISVDIGIDEDQPKSSVTANSSEWPRDSQSTHFNTQIQGTNRFALASPTDLKAATSSRPGDNCDSSDFVRNSADAANCHDDISIQINTQGDLRILACNQVCVKPHPETKSEKRHQIIRRQRRSQQNKSRHKSTSSISDDVKPQTEAKLTGRNRKKSDVLVVSPDPGIHPHTINARIHLSDDDDDNDDRIYEFIGLSRERSFTLPEVVRRKPAVSYCRNTTPPDHSYRLTEHTSSHNQDQTTCSTSTLPVLVTPRDRTLPSGGGSIDRRTNHHPAHYLLPKVRDNSRSVSLKLPPLAGNGGVFGDQLAGKASEEKTRPGQGRLKLPEVRGDVASKYCASTHTDSRHRRVLSLYRELHDLNVHSRHPSTLHLNMTQRASHLRMRIEWGRHVPERDTTHKLKNRTADLTTATLEDKTPSLPQIGNSQRVGKPQCDPKDLLQRTCYHDKFIFLNDDVFPRLEVRQTGEGFFPDVTWFVDPGLASQRCDVGFSARRSRPNDKKTQALSSLKSRCLSKAHAMKSLEMKSFARLTKLKLS